MTKNIFLLETQNPGMPLFKRGNSLGYIPLSEDHELGNLRYFNIYITNDEKAADGDWCLATTLCNSGYGIRESVFKMDPEQRDAMEFLGGQEKSGVLKIVITSDPDLMGDGVSEVHIKFIEWLLKNPEERRIQVVKKSVNVIKKGRGCAKLTNGYRVLIPREPKVWPYSKSKILAISNLIKEHKRTNSEKESLSLDDLLLNYADVNLYPGLSLHTIIRNAYNNGAINISKILYSEDEVKELLIKAKKDDFDSMKMSKYISDEEVVEWFNKNKK
jgi:hypothetical protein